MGVGMALMVSAGVAYCAYKYREHCGRYRVRREQRRFDSEHNPYDGIYQITTADFDPTVRVQSDTPLRDREVVRNGFVGPGGDPQQNTPPSYHAWPNRRYDSLLHKTGSDGSREITLDVSIGISMETAATGTNQVANSPVCLVNSELEDGNGSDTVRNKVSFDENRCTPNNENVAVVRSNELKHEGCASTGISNVNFSKGHPFDSENIAKYDMEPKIDQGENRGKKYRKDHVCIVNENLGDKMKLIAR